MLLAIEAEKTETKKRREQKTKAEARKEETSSTPRLGEQELQHIVQKKENTPFARMSIWRIIFFPWFLFKSLVWGTSNDPKLLKDSAQKKDQNTTLKAETEKRDASTSVDDVQVAALKERIEQLSSENNTLIEDKNRLEEQIKVLTQTKTPKATKDASSQEDIPKQLLAELEENNRKLLAQVKDLQRENLQLQNEKKAAAEHKMGEGDDSNKLKTMVQELQHKNEDLSIELRKADFAK
jgi:hypothetical protein